MRCATCWISRADPPLFYTSIKACERIERTFRERYGPDYKDDDPEVESGLYDAGGTLARPHSKVSAWQHPYNMVCMRRLQRAGV